MRARRMLHVLAGAVVVASLCIPAGVGLAAGSRAAACGPNFQAVPSEDGPGGGGALEGVDGVSPNDVWAVGSTGFGTRTLILHWTGSTFAKVPSPNVAGGDNVLTAVVAISTDDVWAVGNGPAGGLLLHWNGKGWKPSTDPVHSSHVLSGVTAAASDDVYAAGSIQASGEQLPLVLHFDGRSWKRIAVPAGGSGGGSFDAIGASSARNVWAVGQRQVGSVSLPLAEHFDGSAWHTASPTGPKGGSLHAVVAIGAHDVWAVGERPTEFGTASLGEHLTSSGWAKVATPTNGDRESWLYGVTAASPTNIWAAGGSITFSHGAPLVGHSTGGDFADRTAARPRREHERSKPSQTSTGTTSSPWVSRTTPVPGPDTLVAVRCG